MLTQHLRLLVLVSSTVALLAAAPGCSKYGQDSSAAVAIGLPTLVIPEQNHDFGSVVEGAKLTHVFAVKNVGAGPLHIDRVATTCGCTAAILKSKALSPGAESQIEVTFDTNHKGGDNQKIITVFSDDPINPQMKIEIRARVAVVLGVEPEFTQLRTELGKALVSETWLTGALKEQAHLKILELPKEPELKVKVVEKPTDGGVGVQGLRFTLSSKKSGFGSGTVSVVTGLTNPEKVQVGYSWTVEGNIHVSPLRLYFPTDPASATEQTLHVSSRLPEFQLRQVRVVSGPYTASFQKQESGAEYEVHVSLKKGPKVLPAAMKGDGKLELLSNDPLEPRSEVLLGFTPTVAPALPASSVGAASEPQPVLRGVSAPATKPQVRH